MALRTQFAAIRRIWSSRRALARVRPRRRGRSGRPPTGPRRRPTPPANGCGRPCHSGRPHRASPCVRDGMATSPSSAREISRCMELIWPVAPGTRRRVCMSCMVPSPLPLGGARIPSNAKYTSPATAQCRLQLGRAGACGRAQGRHPTHARREVGQCLQGERPRGAARPSRAARRCAALRLRAVRGWGDGNPTIDAHWLRQVRHALHSASVAYRGCPAGR